MGNSQPGCTLNDKIPLSFKCSVKDTENKIFPVLLCPYATKGLYAASGSISAFGSPLGGFSSSGNSAYFFWRLKSEKRIGESRCPAEVKLMILVLPGVADEEAARRTFGSKRLVSRKSPMWFVPKCNSIPSFVVS